MDNIRNLFGQVSTLASSKATGTGLAAAGGSAGGAHANNANGGMVNPGSERQRSISGDFSGMATHQNRAMKQFKTGADRDSYYYIMWRS